MTTLNKDEEKALTTFRSLTNNNVSQRELVEWMNAEDNKPNGEKVNWLKVAIGINSKALVDAAFSNQGFLEHQVNEAIEFGANQEKTNIKVVDAIGKNMVNHTYSEKHAQQSPGASLPEEKSEYKTLSTLSYLKEKVKDFFNKKTDTVDKIAQLREKFSAKSTSTLKYN